MQEMTVINAYLPLEMKESDERVIPGPSPRWEGEGEGEGRGATEKMKNRMENSKVRKRKSSKGLNVKIRETQHLKYHERKPFQCAKGTTIEGCYLKFLNTWSRGELRSEFIRTKEERHIKRQVSKRGFTNSRCRHWNRGSGEITLPLHTAVFQSRVLQCNFTHYLHFIAELETGAQTLSLHCCVPLQCSLSSSP